MIRNITDEVKVLAQDQVGARQGRAHARSEVGRYRGRAIRSRRIFALSATIIFYFAAAFGLVAAGLAAWLAFLIVGGALVLIAPSVPELG